MDLLITLKYQSFFFLNILPRVVSICQTLYFEISTSRNIKLKKLWKNSIFQSFSVFFVFLDFFPPYLWHFENVPIKCPNEFLFYIQLICRRANKKNLVWVSCNWLVSRSPKSGCFFGKLKVELVLKTFSGKGNSQTPCFWIL